jgi:IS1 family transposase
VADGHQRNQITNNELSIKHNDHMSSRTARLFFVVGCRFPIAIHNVLKHNISMNKLPLEKRVAILTALAEGCSMRSTSRMAKVSINTVTKLLIDAGKACAIYQHEKLRNLPCKRFELDEIWSFCYAKDKNVPDELRGVPGYGDVWTWTGIDAETKLIPCWLVGARDLCHARAFVDDLASRLTSRVQITSDGLKAYIVAIEDAFGADVDYAMLIKLYGPEGTEHSPDTKYSPGECCGTKTRVVSGNPDEDLISTSYAERSNLTMRMRMRRFTRLTNGFSKKIENLEYAVALTMMYYNFIFPHTTLTKEAKRKTTPAMAAGVASHVWTMEDLVAMTDRILQRENSN